MDLEIMENLTSNYTFDDMESYQMRTSYYVQIPVTVVTIVAIIANIFIIYVTAKFVNLHDRVHIYIANWCFCDALLLLTNPIAFNLFSITEFINPKAICVLDELYSILFLGNLIFVAILALDWYVNTYSSQAYSMKCRNRSRYTLIIMWILIVILTLFDAVMCAHRYFFPITVLLMLLAYFLVCIIIIGIHVLRIIKMKASSILVVKSNLALILVTCYFLLGLPQCITLFVIMFRHKYYPSQNVEFVVAALGNANAILVLILMYRFDRQFRACIKHMRGRINETEEDNSMDSKEMHATTLI